MRPLLTVLFVFLISISSKAQLSISGIPISTVSNNFRSLALGNAVVSLSEEYGDYHINPAGVGLKNSIQRNFFSRHLIVILSIHI